jgi:hypothetical protein
MDLLPTILKLVQNIVNLTPNVKDSIIVVLMIVKTIQIKKFVQSITVALLTENGLLLMVHINKSSVYQIQNSEKKLSLPNLKLFMDLIQSEQDSKINLMEIQDHSKSNLKKKKEKITGMSLKMLPIWLWMFKTVVKVKLFLITQILNSTTTGKISIGDKHSQMLFLSPKSKLSMDQILLISE